MCNFFYSMIHSSLWSMWRAHEWWKGKEYEKSRRCAKKLLLLQCVFELHVRPKSKQWQEKKQLLKHEKVKNFFFFALLTSWWSSPPWGIIWGRESFWNYYEVVWILCITRSKTWQQRFEHGLITTTTKNESLKIYFALIITTCWPFSFDFCSNVL